MNCEISNRIEIVDALIHLVLLFLIDIGDSLGRLFFYIEEWVEQLSRMATS